jgi:Nucleotidyl transferase AbiEii toxin, Type IV TA system
MTYAAPADFKRALETRIRAASSGLGVQRQRQIIVFHRFLARLVKGLGENTVLKGGLALELRLDHARTTRDIDLGLFGADAGLLEKLQAAGQLNLGDFMTFEVQPSSEVTGDGVVYGGKRFRVECKLAGKVYGARFGLDVVFGGVMTGTPTIITCENFLEFAGIDPPVIRVLPVETHIAEKLHAYTLPRTSPNSRWRDLPDIALLATNPAPLLAQTIRDAIRATFSLRNTHPPPTRFPRPPDHWREPYKALVEENGLIWLSLDSVTDVVERFMNPVLGTSDQLEWSRSDWRWNSP